jgi:hypothetical protein
MATCLGEHGASPPAPRIRLAKAEGSSEKGVSEDVSVTDEPRYAIVVTNNQRTARSSKPCIDGHHPRASPGLLDIRTIPGSSAALRERTTR